ncbi:MAG: NTP transferase domain-containing protein [Candidatus Marinimicrobia bacterium]|nr:NTP transferase domain-containing protein [Candidatus Neomarinimicrobiota bacterium]MBL7022855.1 NTP transferase domain-containing protein [Candidatus Neomarinimicrobiota bacterium]MBL7110045.1 NTP transferase domain-containing protein [Candidatus Neomarinimicrobiota bacterium]
MNYSKNNNRQLSVVILAAGKGTRMKSDLPKVLHEVGKIPMVAHTVRLAKSIGSKKTIVVIGHKYELVEQALQNESVEFAYQLEQKGTGHAVEQCRKQLQNFSGDVLVLSGDVPLLSQQTIKNLIDLYYKTKATASLLSADFDDPTGYGRIIRNSDGTLNRIVEHKDADETELAVKEINAGIYIFDSQTLFRLISEINNENVQQEYYLPDVLPLILSEKNTVSVDKTKYILEIQGVNTEQQLDKLNEEYAKLH